MSSKWAPRIDNAFKWNQNTFTQIFVLMRSIEGVFSGVEVRSTLFFFLLLIRWRKQIYPNIWLVTNWNRAVRETHLYTLGAVIIDSSIFSLFFFAFFFASYLWIDLFNWRFCLTFLWIIFLLWTKKKQIMVCDWLLLSVAKTYFAR